MYNGIEGLKIVVMPYSGGNPQTIFVSGDRSPDLFDKAIKDVVRYIDSTIQSRRVDVSTATQGEILVIYNSAGLKDWVKTENVLRNMSNVKAVNVEAMGGAKVQFRISLIGSPDDLATALKAHQLTLRDNGGFYTLDKSIH